MSIVTMLRRVIEEIFEHTTTTTAGEGHDLVSTLKCIHTQYTHTYMNSMHGTVCSRKHIIVATQTQPKVSPTPLTCEERLYFAQKAFRLDSE